VLVDGLLSEAVWAPVAIFFSIAAVSFVIRAERTSSDVVALLLFLGGVTASSAIVVLVRDQRGRRCFGTMLLWIPVSLALGIAGGTRIRLQQTRSFTAFDRRSVSSVTVRLRDDWYSGRSQRSIDAELMGVETVRGWRGTAGGGISLLNQIDSTAPSAEQIVLRHDLVTVSGHFVGRGVFIAKTLDRRIPGHSVAEPGGSGARSGRCILRSITGAFRLWRRNSIVRVYRRLERLSPNAAGLAEALLLGRRERLNAGLSGLFRRSGAAHLLALSGMHLAVLVLCIRSLLRSILPRMIVPWITLSAAAGYLVLTGPLPSLVRAVAAVGAGVAFTTADVRPSAPAVVMVTVWLVTLFSPVVSISFGFQISVAAVLGLVLFQPVLSTLFAPLFGRVLAAPLGAAYAASVGSGPFVLGAFGVVYPIGLLAAGPAAAVVLLYLISALLYLPVAFVPVLGSLIGAWLELVYSALESFVTFTGSCPGLRWSAISERTMLIALALVPPVTAVTCAVLDCDGTN
jgi:ComEC/Rec2-related protein